MGTKGEALDFANMFKPALDRGDINRERILAQKRAEAEELRDEIASGFNKLFE